MSILFDREAYEKTLKNPYDLKRFKFNLPEYYFQLDYGFPNLNFCTYWFGTEKERKDRIQKMYYYNGKPKEKYWFKLLK